MDGAEGVDTKRRAWTLRVECSLASLVVYSIVSIVSIAPLADSKYSIFHDTLYCGFLWLACFVKCTVLYIYINYDCIAGHCMLSCLLNIAKNFVCFFKVIDTYYLYSELLASIQFHYKFAQYFCNLVQSSSSVTSVRILVALQSGGMITTYTTRTFFKSRRHRFFTLTMISSFPLFTNRFPNTLFGSITVILPVSFSIT